MIPIFAICKPKIHTQITLPVVSDKGAVPLFLFPLVTGLETIMNIH